MDIHEILRLYASSPRVAALRTALCDASLRTVSLQGLVASAAPVVFASVAGSGVPPCLFIMNDADEAGYFYHDLTRMLGNDRVLFFPSSYRRQVKYGQRDAANVILRTEVLGRLSSHAVGQQLYIVTHPEALGELVVSRGRLDERITKLAVGQTSDIAVLARELREQGFAETDYVYEPGQFAVRGSIFDVYSYSSEYPFRIDFFGDEIDSIRTFEVQSQLSKDRRDAIEIVPELATVAGDKVPFIDFLPDDALLVMKDPTFVRDVIDRTYRDGFSSQAVTERLEGATEMEQHVIMCEMRAENMLVSATAFDVAASRFRHIRLGGTASGMPDAVLKFSTEPQPLFHKNFELLTKAFEDYMLRGYRLYVLADSSKQNLRLRDIFDERTATADGGDGPSRIDFTPVDNALHAGFVDNDMRACLFTDHQIFDRFHNYTLKADRARSGRVALSLKELNQIEPGDYIVHIDHGIGIFGGLVKTATNGHPQEMIKVFFQNNDLVLVSIHALHKLSKYRGQEGAAPKVSKLGSGAWQRLKERTKSKMKDMARDLIRLYAQRRHEKGHAFTADNYLQHELEASFAYEDTPDQQKATAAVKADMESPRPMDRLVCGDVGFGKTEIAVRAAFKAACDNKQTALLVPTTVLAMQHYHTFRDRLKDFPVRVEFLSRAKKAAETRQILADLKAGKIDILIGTHKIIGKQVEFKDLGLLVIDEEQKFGVAVKEKLKQLKTNVDTLTMSATPIPRTLQFSLMGARDLSNLNTPPANRQPINTTVSVLDDDTLKEAVSFELSRGGQVFFVTNWIQNLFELQTKLERLVPGVRVVIAHGQMPPEQMEKAIIDFSNRDYDVLLSTTIIENGVDMPNVNTILVNNAHRFGLSELHQLRGRVGRSSRKAFCYLFVPPGDAMTPVARRRLQAIESFSELGSGIHIAMQDLDIRGAGNLLGAEQSGFIADLGYEAYQQILRESVTELKTEEFGDEFQDVSDAATGQEEYVNEVTIESDLELRLPPEYVPQENERITLYRQLDNMERPEQVEEFRAELRDRFGAIPDVSEELIKVVPLRFEAKKAGIERLVLKNGQMRAYFVGAENKAYYQSRAFGRVLEWLQGNPRDTQFRKAGERNLIVIGNVTTVSRALDIMTAINAQQ